MRHLGTIGAILLLTICSSGPARSAGSQIAGVASCSLAAISSDGDPNGLNIRAGPGTGNRVIGRIPPPRKIEGEEFAGEVSVTGSKDGWFRIKDAVMPDYINDDDKDVFSGDGWVSGRYLHASLEEPYLRSGPSTSKPVVADLSKPSSKGESGGPDNFLVEHFYACLGNWVELDGTYFGEHLRGWTYGTCASQVTTCGGGHIPDPN